MTKNPKDDFVEKPFEPYEIDLGATLGLDQKIPVKVFPEQRVVNEGGLWVCMPVGDPGEEPPVPGSIQIEASCGHQVWLAPSGQHIQAMSDKHPLVCSDCASALTLNDA